MSDQTPESAQTLSNRFGAAPRIAIVAGSGLGDFVKALEIEGACSYSNIPGFPAPSVVGHSGELLIGKMSGKRLAVLNGRAHAYEEHSTDTVTAAVRTMARWGCKILLVTNAAGGLNPQFNPGDLMAIASHINMAMRPPIESADGKGPRFRDTTTPFDPELLEAMRRSAIEEGIELHQGVYVCNLGPAFETPAEARMLRWLGADAVGMSTVPEALAAHNSGMRVAGLSYISNSLVHRAEAATTHEEVLRNSQLVMKNLKRLLNRFLASN